MAKKKSGKKKKKKTSTFLALRNVPISSSLDLPNLTTDTRKNCGTAKIGMEEERHGRMALFSQS